MNDSWKKDSVPTLPNFEGKILDGQKCECAICGKKKKIGGFLNPVSKSEDKPPKIVCFDCMMEVVARDKGISKKQAIKERKKATESYHAFLDYIRDSYLERVNRKEKEFESMEEAQAVMDFTRKEWNGFSVELRFALDKLNNKELKGLFKSLKIDFEELVSFVKLETGEKIGRNDSCPCGSGMKYKKCCGDIRNVN